MDGINVNIFEYTHKWEYNRAQLELLGFYKQKSLNRK